MAVYRIAKWKEVFERAESRKLKTLTWIAMPVGFQSNGYQMLLDEFEGEAAAAYGCWCALASYAASCSVRGVLASGKGKPLNIKHIARTTGLPCPIFERLFEWASRSEVGWLEEVDPVELEASIASENAEFPSDFDASGESPEASGDCRGISPSTQSNPTQPNPTEHNPTQPNPTSPNLRTVDGVLDDGGWEIISVDEVIDQCKKLSDAFRHRKVTNVPADDIWRWGWIAGRIAPGLLSELATKVRSKEINLPRKYVESAIRNACADAKVTEAEASQGIPLRREPTHA